MWVRGREGEGMSRHLGEYLTEAKREHLCEIQALEADFRR
jgi:hypothetical protein